MDKKEMMEKLNKQIASCKKCSLCETALNPVPGEGNINAEIVFIGEAPGATEDKLGRPFVGRAGNLLEKLLGDIGLKRQDVWIGNILKHRPPNNREPQPNEIVACDPFLTVQLRAIKPKLVVTLGRFAMYYFYKNGKISRDHGNLITADTGLYVYPVYHPAAALRKGDFLQALEEDFKRIPQILKQIDIEKSKINISSNEEKGQLKLNL
jgi:uracil-DNA glycosylase family 4